MKLITSIKIIITITITLVVALAIPPPHPPTQTLIEEPEGAAWRPPSILNQQHRNKAGLTSIRYKFVRSLQRGNILDPV